MDLPPVPASVTALIASGNLPPELAPLFTAEGQLAADTDWAHVAEAGEDHLAASPDEPHRAALALACAYGRLEDADDGVADPERMAKDTSKAITLLELAEATGINEDETAPLWSFAHRMEDLAAELIDENADLDAYITEHGTTPREQLHTKLRDAHDRYAAGDRAAALTLFRQVAETDMWLTFSGGGDITEPIDIAWCRLLDDAAHSEGPDAAREIWREAATAYRGATFPRVDHACPLIDVLLGTGVPDIVAAIADMRLRAAAPDQPSGLLPWPLDEHERHILDLASAEIAASG
ncbi:hypothetical protein BAY61_15915 [Prauserella marina]|uniref:Uncharacterized protein n=1 Tax=Prauserella marina TaxID=530584 RepID=A0A222VR76_9PSEU|nr:hypothetical protein [Prauserella marina]ASR36243.1 hypothetical protein BAY61_15915 [Prauserella marina]PWV77012.1 hypothetical protein DES30_105229 [Prauserella marina]SDD02365.1 hypothetical protein SAMN05421630_105230 [Prauserella marina]